MVNSAWPLLISMVTTIPAMVTVEGAVTIPAKLFTDLINTLPADSRVDITVPDGSDVARFQCGKTNANVNGAPAADFPPIDNDVTDAQVHEFESERFRNAINKVVFAAAKEESRPILTGVSFKSDVESRTLTLAAADGFRLAVKTEYLEGTEAFAENDVVIPARSIAQLARLLNGKTDGPATVYFPGDGKKVVFIVRRDGMVIELGSSLLAGNFPNYGSLIPESHKTRTVVDAPALFQSVRTAALFARDGSNIIRLAMTPTVDGIEPPQIVVTGQAEAVGEQTGHVDAVECVADPDSDPRIAFNSTYLMDILGLVDKNQLTLETTNPSSPGVFRDMADDGYVHVIMPMMVQW